MHSKHTMVAIAAAVFFGCVAIAPIASSVNAQPEEQQEARPDFGKMLTDGLKDTEGCLGVDSAQFRSGKLGIIAWFENVEAAERWYYSETHKRFMSMAGADAEQRKPMQHIKDRESPVMVMASITMGGDGPNLGFMPITQISIEMYTPLPGGAAINGRLSPDDFPIEHFRRLDG